MGRSRRGCELVCSFKWYCRKQLGFGVLTLCFSMSASRSLATVSAPVFELLRNNLPRTLILAK